MTIISRVLFTGLSLIATACVTTQGGHTYVDGHCVTCLNNPITGQPYNYEKSQAGNYRKTQTGSGNTRFVTTREVQTDEGVDHVHGSGRFYTPVDVDTAYGRIKREFGFLTRKEWAENYLRDYGVHRWETVPGVSYRMRWEVPHTFQGRQEVHYIEFYLYKNGRGTDVTYQFWIPYPKSQIPAFSRSVKARAIRALRR
jgi:hypothetical protein